MFVTEWGSTPINSQAALTEAQEIFKGALGSNANLDPQSTNGQIIQEIANLIINNDSGLQFLYNSVINPNVAEGIFLDAIAVFNQISRLPSTRSIVTCQLAGIAGTVIPEGSQAKSINSDIFFSSEEVIIGGDGTVDCQFLALSYGPIPCGINSVTSIVQSISGWNSIGNSSAGTVGEAQETDYSFRVRRTEVLGLSSTGMVQSLLGKLNNSQNIDNFWLVVNNTSTDTNYTLGLDPYDITIEVPANSIYVSISGGTSDEIGEIFYSTLNGCGTFGPTDITYIDPIYTFMSQNYSYQIPDATRLEIDVNLPGSSDDYTSNIITLIQETVYNSYYGLDGTPKVYMYDPINVSRFIGAIANNLQIYNIDGVTIGLYADAIYETLHLNPEMIGTLDKSDVIVGFAL